MTSAIQQNWQPTVYAKHAGFVSTLGEPLIALLSPKVDECILDLGCGDGMLTAKLANFGCQIVAVDSSVAMVNAAQKAGLDAHLMSGQQLNFNETFDGVFSNAALHWMSSPAAVLAVVWRALKRQGRFVAEMGAAGNVAKIIQALEAALANRGLVAECPWFFPTAEQYQNLLEQAGFQLNYIETWVRPTVLPSAVDNWLTTFAQPYIAVVPVDDRAAFINEVTTQLRPKLCDENGDWVADYVRLRFSASKV